MTKSERECLWVKSALACMGYDSAVVSAVTPDPPDVQVRLDRKRVGVEVIQYHRDLGNNRSRLRAAEARIGEIESCFSDIRREFPQLAIDGEVYFVEMDKSVGGACADRLPLLPETADNVRRFVRELLAFAHEAQPALPEQGRDYKLFDAARFPLMARHVRRLGLCPFDFTPVWNFTPEAMTHGFSQDVCVAHVHKKDSVVASALRRDPARFQRFEELWLLLVSELSSRSSQSLAATLDILQGAGDLNWRATESHFDSILFFQHSEPPRLFVWRRGHGWSQPRGGRE